MPGLMLAGGLPRQLDIAVRHPGDVVGDGPRRAFALDPQSVIVGQQFGVADPGIEEALDNFRGSAVLGFQHL